MDLQSRLRHIPDFPKPGIDFIDITPLLQDAQALHGAVGQLAEHLRGAEFDVIVASEARGFIIGAPLAYALGRGFVPVRKAGKLPYKTISTSYSLEYGQDVLQMHEDAIRPGQRVVIADDLLATGGTALSCVRLVEQLGGKVVKLAFLVELEELRGREDLAGYDVVSLIRL